MEEKKIERMRKRERQIPSCIHSFVEEMMGGEPTLFLSFFFPLQKDEIHVYWNIEIFLCLNFLFQIKDLVICPFSAYT
jgi:hypothetical protein